MKSAKLPVGWDNTRVQKLIEHYEGQSEEEALVEDETTLDDPTQVIMEVPRDLVPAVRRLIAGHHPAKA